MNKLIFTVTGPEKDNISLLIKEIIKIECRITLDIQKGFVTVENVNDNQIDTVIDLINSYYVLLGVEINNLTNSSQVVKPCDNVHPSFEGLANYDNSDFLTTLSNVISYPRIQYALEKLLQSIDRDLKMYPDPDKRQDTANLVIDSIWNANKILTMICYPQTVIPCNPGDVVECYIGRNLPKELNGSRVTGIVANISSDNLIYFIPITRSTDFIAASSSLYFSAPTDIAFTESNMDCGTVIFDTAKNIRAERVLNVIGHATPQFMEKVYEQLIATFDFRGTVIVPPVIADVDTSSDNGEMVLSKIVEDALKNLNPKDPISISAKQFVTDIGMDSAEKLLIQAFIASYSVSKITYESICSYLKDNINTPLSERQIAEKLKNFFKDWADGKQELNNYPRLAFTSLLKLFIKELKKDKSYIN